MKTTNIKCPRCDENLEVPLNFETIGKELKCDCCGCVFVLPEENGKSFKIVNPYSDSPKNPETTTQKVIVTGVNMGFGSVVLFITQCALASIPAIIILATMLAILVMAGGVLVAILAGA